jgi:hypothetical protein
VAKDTGFSRFFLVDQTELEPKCLEIVTFFKLLAEISFKIQKKTENLKKNQQFKLYLVIKLENCELIWPNSLKVLATFVAFG